MNLTRKTPSIIIQSVQLIRTQSILADASGIGQFLDSQTAAKKQRAQGGLWHESDELDVVEELFNLSNIYSEKRIK